MTGSNSFADYKGRSVLITGGLGFIGSNLARKLVEIGDVDVTILDPLLPDQGGNIYNVHDIRNKVKLHQGNMRDDQVINYLVAGVDYIFNLAGSTSHLDSMQLPHRDLELNCAAQLSLLEACRRSNPHVRIVYTSTRQVYGKPVYLPLDEQHPVAPLDVNGINKLAAERYHLLYHNVYGTRVTCLRLTNTYGPRQQMYDGHKNFIAWFIRQAIDGEIIELYGEGRHRRDMNYVDDVIEALLLTGSSETAEGEVFNLGSEESVTLSEVARKLISITGRGSVRNVPFPIERQMIEIGNCYLSYKKIETALGWRPRTGLQEGLTRTVEFYQKHRSHYWQAVSRSQVRA